MNEINSQNKKEIFDIFSAMQDEKDLLALINYVGQCLYGQKTKSLRLKQLTYQANHKNHSKSRYEKFTIVKKNGKKREIYAPNKTLKYIQKCLNIALNTIFTPHHAAKGFVPNKSIKDNAILHVGTIYVYNIDLKDFFTSIDKSRIWACLKNPPFKLNAERARVADFIAGLCCEKLSVERLNNNNEWGTIEKFVLPQGAPTSPTLSNVVTQRLDYLLSAVAKKFGLKYSRYADDITFSSMHNVYQKDSEFLKEIHRIITEQNFYINESKTRLQVQGNFRQEVTGVVVNEKLNVRKSYIKEVRKWLYLWERHGYDNANNWYLIAKTKVIRQKNKGLHLENVIDGKLNYLKMIVGSDDSRYKGLNKRFEVLANKKEEKPKEEKPSREVERRNEIDLSKHKPSETKKLLQQFRTAQNPNEGLKYLIHDFDNAEEFDLNKLIKTANKELKDNSLHGNIPSSLYARIDTFINNNSKDKHWTSFRKKYIFGWASDEIKDWSKNNPFSHPINNDKFRENIIAFRKTIRIQDNLKEIIELAAKEKLSTDFAKFEIDYVNVESADLPLDVDKFSLGIRGIFSTIRDNISKSKKIKIEYIGKARYKRLRIIHVDSTSTKPLDEINTDEGNFQEIFKNFFQVCDWSITSKNPDENYNIINFLSEKNKESKEKIDEDEILGFTHELTFY